MTTTIGRVLATAEVLGRDLLRRRLALVMLVALPVAFYAATRWSEGGYAYTSGGMGISWSIAGAALYSALAARPVDRRLVLDGYRPAELLAGRVVVLMAFGLSLALAFGALMYGVAVPRDAMSLFVSLVLVAGIAVPFGLAIAALVPRELEGTLLLIGVVGIAMSLPSGSALEGVMPFGGPHRLLALASGRHGGFAPPVLRAVAWSVLLLALATAAWWERVHVTRHPRAVPHARHVGRVALGLMAAGAIVLLALA